MKKRNFGNIGWSLLAIAILMLTAIPHVVADEIELPISTIEFDNPLPEGMEVIVSEIETGPTRSLESGGWKASLFFIRSNRFMTDTGRMKLDGWYSKEIIWLNGFDHESHTTGYMEFWYTDNGEEKYFCSGYNRSIIWSGFAIFMMWLKITVWFPDHEQYEISKIHVYGERVVDDFETEYYNKVFYKYFIHPYNTKISSVVNAMQ